ncbi:6,7-dimethyl-8-ribityllumazine synthase [Betaproteobacteria bacterium SCN2]|jgi:6,7-dimethyl-8-ribityllumazine synthase|nr:6,7-dimethyl-8-ribityllumazine synthase [Betaproteobacteria bacterium SCN2]
MGTNTGFNELDPAYQGKGLRIGITMSRFNTDICEGLLSACERELIRLGVAKDDILLVTVPGALEHPIALKKLAQGGKFDALIAIGSIVRGETYHFEVVSNESARGITDVQLQTGVPVANAVLTLENDDQGYARMSEKGTDAARVAIEMANLMKRI